jgi:hypothetical protein
MSGSLPSKKLAHEIPRTRRTPLGARLADPPSSAPHAPRKNRGCAIGVRSRTLRAPSILPRTLIAHPAHLFSARTPRTAVVPLDVSRAPNRVPQAGARHFRAARLGALAHPSHTLLFAPHPLSSRAPRATPATTLVIGHQSSIMIWDLWSTMLRLWGMSRELNRTSESRERFLTSERKHSSLKTGIDMRPSHRAPPALPAHLADRRFGMGTCCGESNWKQLKT